MIYLAPFIYFWKLIDDQHLLQWSSIIFSPIYNYLVSARDGVSFTHEVACSKHSLKLFIFCGLQIVVEQKVNVGYRLPAFVLPVSA